MGISAAGLKATLVLVAVVSIGMLLGAIESATVALAKPGRVVRIERATARAGKQVRACQYSRLGADAQMTCVGKNDFEEGDVFDVLAEDGSYARAHIKSVKAAQIDVCNLGFIVDITARITDEVNAPSSTGYPRKFAIRGIDVTPGVSKLLPTNQVIQAPSGNARDQVIMSADTDGDDQAEFVAVLSDCPTAKKNIPWVPSGRTVTSFCIDYWTRSGPDWKKAGSEVFHHCQ